jgi:hypothetical protein
MNKTDRNPSLLSGIFRRSPLVFLLVSALLCCASNGAYAETMKVTGSNNLACTGTISVASTTGVTSSNIGPNSNFEFNVTSLSRIMSATILWNVGNQNSMCLAYCQLYVNGVKHTSGTFTIYSWTKNGPQYSFTDIQGSNVGSQRMECVRDDRMSHLPAQYGEHPLP